MRMREHITCYFSFRHYEAYAGVHVANVAAACRFSMTPAEESAKSIATERKSRRKDILLMQAQKQCSRD